MPQDHYGILLEAAKQVKKNYPGIKPGKNHAKFRWNLLYGMNGMKKFLPQPNFVLDLLYEYMNDKECKTLESCERRKLAIKRLDTALKNIVKEVF